MHGCTSGPMLLVNAELDSMGGFGINSTPSLQQSSDLEKTQAELRQTFTTAEKFRSELEYLQKGGDPLDLKPGNAASLTNRHPEQFVTSEAKCRLGAPLSCEPNSADNLMLLKESGNSTVLEIPKKSYKRRVRTRPNRDPFRHVSRDLLNSNSTPNPKSPNELDGVPPVQSTLVPAVQSKALIEPESAGNVQQVNLSDSKCPNILDPTKILDAESSCTQNSQRFDDFNGNGQPTTGQIEQNIEMKKDIAVIKEEKPNIVVGPTQDENTCNNRPQGSSGPHMNPESNDGAEQNACSQDNLKLAVKEHEDSILEEARIIEAKRKRITELSDRTLPPEKRLKSQWDFVLEEMSWLANDFAQEHLWKVIAAAQISQRVAFASRVRLQQQSSLQKHKQLSHTLAESVMEFWHMIQVKCKEKDDTVGVQGYAIRFMEYNNSCQVQWDPPQAHDTVSDDLVSMDPSWEHSLTEENLFYTVPPGAIEAYRKAIDSHLLQFERTGSCMQEEVDTSGYDAVADNTFGEDEGETSTYYLPGANTAQKRRKKFKLYGPNSFEKTVGKRSGNSLNACTPSRQRIITPFSAGISSGDNNNNSFQDEQSGGPHVQNNNMEAESVGDYEKQLHFDSMEVLNRPKKKKKTKHPGSVFRNRWQLESNFQNDQKDYARRVDTHQYDSNGSSVASQMSNMSNPNKFMKILVRDRGRKVKALKTPVVQPDSGSTWSLFEDQALVVLVHDMGPNWELITDAINNTLQFKCIFRKSEECKERHGILMDRNNGDGADSAEDSQPYPSTLPRIPEGSARQLFQRLQGPMEEDTLKSHFEKIIMIGQKQHYRRMHNDNQDPKQLQQPHKSHAIALSQVYPNNLTGGPVLTPLELCEAVSSTPDVAQVGYQGPHNGGLPGLNNGSVPPTVPGSGSGSGSATSAPGSNNSVHGASLPSASAPLNPSVREGRYGTPRTGSLSVEDQQKLQQYNQMLSAKQSGGPHSVTDRGVRMLPAGNGMCGVNRNMKMTRPGFPASTSMLNSGQGNSMLRPRDPMHMIRPNQNTEQQVSQSGPTQGIPSYRPPNNTQHPALAMRFAKERQLQQRLLLKQQQFATSNPVTPPVQQDSQLPVSSPQNTTPPPRGPPQTRPRMPHQLPPQQRQQLMKGGVMNGLSGGQQSSLSQPYQQKTFSSQTHKSTDGNNNDKNQVKLVNRKQATTTTPQKVLLNRKVNMFDQSTSKQTESTQTNTAVTMPNAANSTEPPVVSSGDAGTQLGKNPARVVPPQATAESENSRPVMSQVTDKLVNSVGNDEGVQWQQQQPPS